MTETPYGSKENTAVDFLVSQHSREVKDLKMQIEQLLQSNKVFEYKEGKITHYIYVKSVLRRGEIAPLLFIKNDVTKMIIHQKKLKYLQDLENKLIQEAIQNNTYEKY